MGITTLLTSWARKCGWPTGSLCPFRRFSSFLYIIFFIPNSKHSSSFSCRSSPPDHWFKRERSIPKKEYWNMWEYGTQIQTNHIQLFLQPTPPPDPKDIKAPAYVQSPYPPTIYYLYLNINHQRNTLQTTSHTSLRYQSSSSNNPLLLPLVVDIQDGGEHISSVITY